MATVTPANASTQVSMNLAMRIVRSRLPHDGQAGALTEYNAPKCHSTNVDQPIEAAHTRTLPPGPGWPQQTHRSGHFGSVLRGRLTSVDKGMQRGLTDRRSVAGAAATRSQPTRTLDAGPVHCSVWLDAIAARLFGTRRRLLPHLDGADEWVGIDPP